jgi:hypothetical protein
VAALVLTEEEVRSLVREEVARLRLELERLRGVQAPALAPFPEAARRLNISLRAVQQRAKDGRLQVELVGGVRMVRLPAGAPQG